MKTITEEQRNMLRSPLPAEAITQNPAKTFLSAIKPIYIVERLNDVFGVGSWNTKVELLSIKDDGTTLVKTSLDIPEYNIHIEQFGGHQDKDLGDSAKGSATDALTKCASYLEIGIDVFRGKQTHNNQPQQNNTQYNKGIDFNDIDKCNTVEELTKLYNEAIPQLKTDKQKEAFTKKCTYRKNWIVNHGNIIPSNPNLEYHD